jgi:hypothetical protein
MFISLDESSSYDERSSVDLQTMLDEHHYVSQNDRHDIEEILEQRGELYN